MEDFLSLLVFLAICIVLSSARKKRREQSASAARVRKPAAGKEKDRIHRSEPSAPSRDRPQAPKADPQPEMDYGSLSRSFSMEGTDPCHDDPRVLPAGSLQIDSPEGKDPCHDDPSALPIGSLRIDFPEGEDPCHPASAEMPPRNESPVSPAGQVPGFPGNEIVRGFIWGEILNRKRA